MLTCCPYICRQDVRQVELKEGNLILDVPVPAQIIPPGNKSEEMNKMRYTACTVDPDLFAQSKYTLRPFLYGRKTELFSASLTPRRSSSNRRRLPCLADTLCISSAVLFCLSSRHDHGSPSRHLGSLRPLDTWADLSTGLAPSPS